jgi:hypothetical protein
VSTIGYEIERHEVEALRDNLLGDLLAEQDDLIAYQRLTREQALCDALVSEIKRLRGERLRRLAEGRTAEQVADLTGLGTRQRVQQLMAVGLS